METEKRWLAVKARKAKDGYSIHLTMLAATSPVTALKEGLLASGFSPREVNMLVDAEGEHGRGRPWRHSLANDLKGDVRAITERTGPDGVLHWEEEDGAGRKASGEGRYTWPGNYAESGAEEDSEL